MCNSRTSCINDLFSERREETGLEDSDDDDDDDWFIEQELPQDQSTVLASVKYGFANRLSGFFAHCEVILLVVWFVCMFVMPWYVTCRILLKL